MSSSSAPLGSIATHRHQFPQLAGKHYFNYGGQGPMPQAALAAVSETQDYIQQLGPFSNQVNRWIGGQNRDTRAAIARALAAPTATITLTENVSVGCNIPLWGMDWSAGGHILLTDCEHPGIIAAVGEVQRRFGVEVTTCPILATLNTGDPVAVVKQYLQPHTRLLVISHILWNTGQVLPLREISDLCHQFPTQHGQPIRVLVDAAQSVGMMPLNLPELGVDFYAFTGHKWWCGPAGVGGLYVSADAQAAIAPTYIGWRGITTDAQGNPTGWETTGQRYEVATSNYALYPALQAAIATHEDWGSAAARYDRLVALSQSLWEQLRSRDYIHCLRQTPPDSGLISFQIVAEAAQQPQIHSELVNRLEQEQYFLRTILHPNCVRACVHYFTLESELAELLDRLDHHLRQMAVIS